MKGCLLALALLAVVVASSGCTTSGGVISSGKGIVIESFEPEFPQIFSNEAMKLHLKVRNTGVVDGTIKSVELSNVELESQGATGDCKDMEGKKLLAAVPDKGISGGVATCSWAAKLKNNIPSGLTVPFQPGVRVKYEYSTTTVKSITLGTSDELRNLQNRGGTLPADAVSSTGGPVSIDIVSKGPIRVSSGGVEFPIEIVVNNVGGGTVCLDSSCENDLWNRIRLDIDTGGLEISENSCEKSKVYDLWKGGTNTIGCRLTAMPSDAANSRVQKLIRVDAAGYGYMIDASTSVTVEGQSGLGSSGIYGGDTENSIMTA